MRDPSNDGPNNQMTRTINYGRSPVPGASLARQDCRLAPSRPAILDCGFTGNRLPDPRYSGRSLCSTTARGNVDMKSDARVVVIGGGVVGVST
jgi:hypothetical protein